MRSFTWIVLTNCDPAHDAEFNRWYDDVHLPDLLRVPGIVSARRSRLADVQMTMVNGELAICGAKEIDAKFKYLACYKIEADDVSRVLEEVKRRSGSPEMYISQYLTEAFTLMHEDIP